MFFASIVVCIAASQACMTIESARPNATLEECEKTVQKMGEDLLSDGTFKDGTTLEIMGLCTKREAPERAS